MRDCATYFIFINTTSCPYSLSDLYTLKYDFAAMIRTIYYVDQNRMQNKK